MSDDCKLVSFPFYYFITGGGELEIGTVEHVKMRKGIKVNSARGVK